MCAKPSVDSTRQKLSHLDLHGSETVEGDASVKLQRMEDAFKTILQSVGEDVNRQGILKTPTRAAKAFLYFTKGYEEDVASMFIQQPDNNCTLQLRPRKNLSGRSIP